MTNPMRCRLTFEERRDRARAYAMVLRQRLVVKRAELRRLGFEPATEAPQPTYEVARAAAMVRAALHDLEQALAAKPRHPVRVEWRRAELEVARIALEIEQLILAHVDQDPLAA